MLKPIEKALLNRKSLHLRAKEPFTAFSKRISKPRQILHLVERSDLDASVKFEARRQFIVTLMTAFEIYWKDLLRITIDKSNLNNSQLSRIKDSKFSLSEVSNIVGKKLSLGELLTNIYSCQNRYGVEKFISDLLGVDLYSHLRSSKLSIGLIFDDKKKNEIPVDINYLLKHSIPILDKCQTIRNHVVHDSGIIYRPSMKDIYKYESAIGLYNLFVGVGVEFIFDLQCREK